MSYDPRTEATPVARNKQTLSAEQCRAINATLPPRLKCAVLHARRGKAIIFVERPRNAGKAPKRGVHIPHPARVMKGLAKVSKHAKQQSRDGKFGNQGERTIDRKLALLESSSLSICEQISGCILRHEPREVCVCFERRSTAAA